MAEKWREFLALALCHVVIGTYFVTAPLFGPHLCEIRSLVRRDQPPVPAVIIFIPCPIRAWCFHLGTGFEHGASVTLFAGLALIACTWMGKGFYGMPGRRVMDERLAPFFAGSTFPFADKGYGTNGEARGSVFSRRSAPLAQRVELSPSDRRSQPRAGEGPVPVGGAWRDVERFGGLIARQSPEVAQFNEFRLDGMDRGELLKGFVEGE